MKTFFHYTTMQMHLDALTPVFAALKQMGWKSVSQGQDRAVAFLTCGADVKQEFVNLSPIVWLPHGLSISKWAFPHELCANGALLPNLLLLPGPHYEQRLKLGCASGYMPDVRYEVVGWPKADSYFDGSLDVPIGYESPVILFAPSWNYSGSTTVGTFSMWQEVQKELAPLGGTLLIAPHPVDRVVKGPWTITEGPINRWVMAADVVVSDQSSVAMEAACAGKPVVHLCELYARRGWAPYDGEQFVVGHTATLATLRNETADAIEHPERFDYLRRYWCGAMCANPGHAAREAALAVVRFMEDFGK